MALLKYYDTATSQWLPILAGAKGETGNTGPTGPAGPQGEAGTATVSVVAPITNTGTTEDAIIGFDDTDYAKLASSPTFTGVVSASGFSNAQAKNALVASGFNSASGGFANTSRVIMTATGLSSTDPTTRPDGTTLQVGDLWFDF
jgi:hypothetical protein